MFTGIITDIGIVTSLDERDGWLRLGVQAPVTAARVAQGSSVAVGGVCLTVNVIENGVMEFSLLPETIRVTDIGTWKVGTHVNLECALRVGDELGGHFVYGHVDGLGTIVALSQEDDSIRLRIALPSELMRYTAPKGSVSLDGTSLTIMALGDDYIEVTLVEYTLVHTTFGSKSVGDHVHVENDMLLKFIAGQNKK